MEHSGMGPAAREREGRGRSGDPHRASVLPWEQEEGRREPIVSTAVRTETEKGMRARARTSGEEGGILYARPKTQI